MGAVIRRANSRDEPNIAELIESRRVAGDFDAREGGVLEGPSHERIAEAIADDIVIVAERDGRLIAAALIMEAPTFRATEWWELRHGLEHPDVDPDRIDELNVAHFELLVARSGLNDRRPVVRVAYEAIRSAAATHDLIVASTMHHPFLNAAAHRMMTAVGFIEIGTVQYPFGDILVTAKLHAVSSHKFEEATALPETAKIIETSVGAGIRMPPFQCGRSAWRGEDLDAHDWTIDLRPDQIDELRAMVERCVTVPEDLLSVTRDDTPLRSLEAAVADLGHRLLAGLGFALVRGLPVDDMSPLEQAGCFYLLGLHLGNPRSQNAAGDLLGHVRDIGLRSDDPNVRIYQTNERQTFHTDSTDVVGLLCLRPARSGGESLLVSAMTVYNELISRDSALTAHLLEPVATDRRGEIPEGADPWFEIAPFTWHENQLSVLYQRQYIESAQRFDDAPRLTPETTLALDAMDDLANDPSLGLRMSLAPGDMQFVNNHVLLHDRTSFDDEADQPRHLLRLWLSMPGDRPLPTTFEQRFGTVTIGDRGGVVVAGADRRISVVAE